MNVQTTRERRRKSTCFVMLVFAVSSACLDAQQALRQKPPAATMTGNPSLPEAQPTAAAAASLPAMPAPKPNGPKPAEVRWSDSRLSIVAENSSLSEILNQVTNQTGMVVNGGIPDERVFGSYGPGAAAEVLTALLDGTGLNLLLQQDDRNRVRQLVLVARNGEASQPSGGSASGGYGNTDQPPQMQPRQPNRPPRPFEPGSAAYDSGTGNGFNDQQSPNGILTPQQMYDEQLRMRRAALMQAEDQISQAPQEHETQPPPQEIDPSQQ